MSEAHPTTPAQLKRELRLPGAVALGMGSILGTGVFVSLAMGASIAGDGVLIAILLAGALACCNGLSSARLAAVHPVSGGTYEYGYRELRPAVGFTAGWMFLCAKTASAASAALVAAGYLMQSVGLEGHWLRIGIAAGLVVLFTALVLTGLRRSNVVNMVIVIAVLLGLLVFVVVGFARGSPTETWPLEFSPAPSMAKTPALWRLLQCSAIVFVAYTGYGRVATLGEEVHNPAKTIPRAVIFTLGLTIVLYLLVAYASLAIAGSEVFAGVGTGSAPLRFIAELTEVSWLPVVISIAALLAMLGVLLNLILGVSRVLLAMGRRGDMPQATAKLNQSGSTPWVAVIITGAIIVGLTFIGDVKTTWSFSAFTVLVYYSITNLAALRLKGNDRLRHPWLATLGLVGCLSLAVFVGLKFLLVGLGLIVVGLVWHAVARRISPPANTDAAS